MINEINQQPTEVGSLRGATPLDASAHPSGPLIQRNENPRELQSLAATRPWVGFDLDDTLHEFRKASGVAIDATLHVISETHQLPMGTLKAAYKDVLGRKTSSAFTEGKTSHEYRRDRFSTTMAELQLTPDENLLTSLLDIYETALTEALTLKPGVMDLLSHLKEQGKKIVVITEGPQDAQERTVEALGISGYIDFLATTNRFRASKTNGLFPQVLEHLGISSVDLVYVGDSFERDMAPAMAEGILCVHLDEKVPASLETCPPKVSSMQEARRVLSSP